jgi:hypothetical protein
MRDWTWPPKTTLLKCTDRAQEVDVTERRPAQGGVVMEASPSAPVKISETNLLFEPLRIQSHK